MDAEELAIARSNLSQRAKGVITTLTELEADFVSVLNHLPLSEELLVIHFLLNITKGYMTDLTTRLDSSEWEKSSSIG